ncbi:MAG: ATP-binding protein [Myxococcota bacterium]
MNLATAIAIASSILCLYVSVLSFRFARAPGWEHERWFAAIALSAAVYTAGDFAFTSMADPQVLIPIARWQILAGGFNLAAWVIYAQLVLRGPPIGRRVLLFAATLPLASALSFIPGFFFTGRINDVYSPWVDVTYHMTEATDFGNAVFTLLVGTFLGVAIRFGLAWRRRVEGAREYCLVLAALVAAGTNDSLVTANVLQTPLLLDIGYLLPVAVGAALLTKRFIRDAVALADLSQTLESKVEERSRELLKAKEELLRSEKLAAIGQIAAGVAHEINNPAAILKANLTYLVDCVHDGDDPSDCLACMNESLSAVERIATIVRQLSLASRAVVITQNQNTPTNVAAAVQRSIEGVNKARGVTLPVTVTIEPSLFVSANEVFLDQILTNLLTNAWHAESPERPLAIQVSARPVNGRMWIDVQDNGTGMTPEVQRHMFDPFFTTKPVGKGSGLGLSVCLGLVRDMGGNIEAQSELGRGTLLRIDLAAAEATWAVAPRATPELSSTPRCRLLVVDDDLELRSALARSLEDDYDVELADGVQSAHERLRREPRPDTVLCDLMMPAGGGKRLYEDLLQARSDLISRFVFITGGAVDGASQQFLLTQPQPVLYKPFTLQQLATAIHTVLSSAERRTT